MYVCEQKYVHFQLEVTFLFVVVPTANVCAEVQSSPPVCIVCGRGIVTITPLHILFIDLVLQQVCTLFTMSI